MFGISRGLALAVMLLLAIGLICFAQPTNLGPPGQAAPQIVQENAQADVETDQAAEAITHFAAGPRFAVVQMQPVKTETGFRIRTREAGETKFPLRLRIVLRARARGAL